MQSLIFFASLIYPTRTESFMERFYFGSHVILWLAALGLNGFICIRIRGEAGKDTLPDAVSPASPPSPASPVLPHIVSGSTQGIAVVGWISTFVGVVLLCITAYMVGTVDLKKYTSPEDRINLVREKTTVKSFKTSVPALSLITLLTTFGTVTSLYVCCEGSREAFDNSGFTISTYFGVAIQSFAQFFLYNITAAFDISRVPSSFKFALAASIHLIIMTGILSGDFVEGDAIGKDKTIAWACPLMLSLAFIVIFANKLIRPDGFRMDAVDLVAPEMKALVMFLVATALVLSLHTCTIVKRDGTPGLFSLFGLVVDAILLQQVLAKTHKD